MKAMIELAELILQLAELDKRTSLTFKWHAEEASRIASRIKEVTEQMRKDMEL